jgi:hypothetical protein
VALSVYGLLMMLKHNDIPDIDVLGDYDRQSFRRQAPDLHQRQRSPFAVVTRTHDAGQTQRCPSHSVLREDLSFAATFIAWQWISSKYEYAVTTWPEGGHFDPPHLLSTCHASTATTAALWKHPHASCGQFAHVRCARIKRDCRAMSLVRIPTL